MDILERIKFISKIAYDFEIDDYLQDKSKSLLIFRIDTVSKKYSLLFGNDIDNILESANLRFVDSMAGYKVDVHKVFSKKTPSDLFLISDIVINSNPTHIDSIIIHEIAHLLIDSNNQCMSLASFITDMALKLYYSTDIENVEKTRHDKEFCKLLVYGCINYQSETKNFKTLQETVESAMRYDIYEPQITHCHMYSELSNHTPC